MYAVIQTGGKQYRVAPGETIQIERLPWDVGSELELRNVLAVFNDEQRVLTGEQVANSKVIATITAHGRAPKVRVFKFRRKKQYKRTIGHRQNFTSVRVNEIVA